MLEIMLGELSLPKSVGLLSTWWMILYTKNLQPNLRMSNSGRKIGSASLRHEIVAIENEALFSELLERRVQITSSKHQNINSYLGSWQGCGRREVWENAPKCDKYWTSGDKLFLQRCFKVKRAFPHLKEDWVKEEVPGLGAAGRVCDQALSDEIFLLLVLQGLDALLDGFCCHLAKIL